MTARRRERCHSPTSSLVAEVWVRHNLLMHGGASPEFEPARVTVRPAGPADGPAMRRLAVEAYQHYLPRIGAEPAPMRADYPAIIATGNGWVAQHGEAIVGLLVLVPYRNHLLIENIAVAPALQGRGIGARLLRLAEDRARQAGIREIRLYTNEAMTENLGYYPRRGYRETHRATEHGFGRVFFSKYIEIAGRG